MASGFEDFNIGYTQTQVGIATYADTTNLPVQWNTPADPDPIVYLGGLGGLDRIEPGVQMVP